MRSIYVRGLGLLVVSFCAVAGAVAQPSTEPQPGAALNLPSEEGPIPGPGPSAAPQGTGPSPGQPGYTVGLFSRPNLLGDIYGLRTLMGRYGLSLGLQETSEVFGNVTGGIRRGAAYDGLTTLSLGLDTAKAFGWEGGVFNVSAFQIHGRSISADNLLTLQTESGIQAQRSTRLWEMWFQQSLLGGKADVKIGQMSLDTEFMTSQGSGVFVNTAMGWPLLPSADQYAGGPAYPLSSLGVRVRVRPFGPLTVLAGVFDDNPAGGRFNETNQLRGAAQSGTRFNLGTGALVFGEVQYALAAESGRTGTYKLGFWYDSGTFYDQRFDAARLSLSDPASSGDPRVRRHNYSLYGVADQIVWRPDAKAPQALGVFARVMGAPGDRNLVSFSINGGLTLTAPFAGRDNDIAGLGCGVGRIGSGAIRADRDANAFGTPTPVRGTETFIEATYQMQVAPWLLVQPDLQYVFSPGGGIRNPLRPEKRVGNATVLGLRSNFVF